MDGWLLVCASGRANVCVRVGLKIPHERRVLTSLATRYFPTSPTPAACCWLAYLPATAHRRGTLRSDVDSLSPAQQSDKRPLSRPGWLSPLQHHPSPRGHTMATVQSPTQDHQRQKYTRCRGGCNRCRRRRQKCDQQRPSCGRCTQAGVDGSCRYEVKLSWGGRAFGKSSFGKYLSNIEKRGTVPPLRFCRPAQAPELTEKQTNKILQRGIMALCTACLVVSRRSSFSRRPALGRPPLQQQHHHHHQVHTATTRRIKLIHPQAPRGMRLCITRPTSAG